MLGMGQSAFSLGISRFHRIAKNVFIVVMSCYSYILYLISKFQKLVINISKFWAYDILTSFERFSRFHSVV